MKNILKILFVIYIILDTYSIKADWPVLYTGEFSGSHNFAYAITADNYGNCYVTGLAETFDQNDTLYHTITTICYLSDGTQKWKSIHRNSYSYGSGKSIVYDPSGFIYVTGYFVDPFVLPFTPFNMITLKIDATYGTEIWSREYTDGDCCGNCVDFDNSGNIYVTGKSHSGFNNWSTGNYCTTIKYDQFGNRLWVVTHYGGFNDIAYSLKESGEYLYVTGLSYSSNNDFLTIKYDLNGVQQWLRTYDNGGEDYSTCIDVNPSFGVYVAGTSQVSDEYRAATIHYDFTGFQTWVNNNYTGCNYSVASFTRPINPGGGIRGPSTNTVDVFTTGYGGYYPDNGYGQTIKYSTSGGTSWREIYNSINDYPFLVLNTIKIDASENIFVCGYDHINSGGNYESWYTLKYASSGGTPLWVETRTTEI